jgi:hypothetical protein
MAYDPQLRLDPTLLKELRKVYPELTHKFHVLLANLLDNRPLPANANFLHHFAFQTPININVFLNNSLCFCKYL